MWIKSLNKTLKELAEDDPEAGTKAMRAENTRRELCLQNRDVAGDELGLLMIDAMKRANVTGSKYGKDFRPTVNEVAYWANARTLMGVQQWGLDTRQQNLAYSMKNHLSMARDQARVESYALALRRVARGANVCDVGSGPFCLLSRLALGAGAATVTAIEHSEQAVQKAIDYFMDEMHDERERYGGSGEGREYGGEHLRSQQPNPREPLADRDGLNGTAAGAWGTAPLLETTMAMDAAQMAAEIAAAETAAGTTKGSAAAALAAGAGAGAGAQTSSQPPGSKQPSRREQMGLLKKLDALRILHLKILPAQLAADQDARDARDARRRRPRHGGMQGDGRRVSGRTKASHEREHGRERKPSDVGANSNQLRAVVTLCHAIPGASDAMHCDASEAASDAPRPTAPRLELFQGYSSGVSPVLARQIASGQRPRFSVVVHEILGHVASSEGVALAIQDLHRQQLCAPGCVFVPCAAQTLLAPCGALPSTPLDAVVHRYLNGGPCARSLAAMRRAAASRGGGAREELCARVGAGERLATRQFAKGPGPPGVA